MTRGRVGLGGCRGCWADGRRRETCARCRSRRSESGLSSAARRARMASDARSVVLERIQQANGGASSAEKAAAGWSEIRRGYRRGATRSRAEVIELLIDRLRDYDAEVVEVGPSGVAEAAAKMMGARRAAGNSLRRLVV